MDELEKMRDIFRETADILDELIGLKGREETAETKKQCGSILSRFMIKMAEIEVLRGL
jgi:hypothetical protein